MKVLLLIFIFGIVMSIFVINSIDFIFVFMNFFYRNRMYNLYIYVIINKDILYEYKIEIFFFFIFNIVEIFLVL